MKITSNPPKRLRDRALLILGLVAYILCYQWIYVNYLYKLLGEYDYHYQRPSIGCMILAWTLSILPGTWMPLALTRPSQLGYWILYVIVIIPSMFVSFYIGLNRQGEIIGLLLVLFLGFLIVGSSYLLPLLPVRPRPISRRVFWAGVVCLAVGLMLWVIIIFRGNLRFVSFANAYELRFNADEIIRGSYVSYALTLLTCAIDPFLIGWGLYHGRAGVVIAGILGQILVYSAFAYKASIMSIVLILLIYLILRKNHVPFALKLVWGTTALLGMCALSYVVVGESPSPIHQVALYFVFVRIFSSNAVLTGQYYFFFQHHPLTYYSHVKGMHWLVPYPYPSPIGSLGNEIGYFYSGDWSYGATVHFWASDGIAALGLPGILVISVVCMVVFWLIDSAAQGRDPRLGALIISYVAAWNLVNNGLFNALVSDGLALLILILYVLPVEDRHVLAKNP